MHPLPSLEDCFYGSVTLGERGQVVIPADARRDCDIHASDKLLVFRHPLHPNMLMLAKVGELQQLLEQMSRSIDQMSKQLQAETSSEEAQGV